MVWVTIAPFLAKERGFLLQAKRFQMALYVATYHYLLSTRNLSIMKNIPHRSLRDGQELGFGGLSSSSTLLKTNTKRDFGYLAGALNSERKVLTFELIILAGGGKLNTESERAANLRSMQPFDLQ
jgi:hypothetical protein